MRVWGKMERVKWTEKLTNIEVLNFVNEALSS